MTRGQLVPYMITVTNGVAVNLPDVTVVDRFPAGFRYVEGSARLDGVAARARPSLAASSSWTDLTVTPTGATRSCCCSPSAPASAKASS